MTQTFRSIDYAMLAQTAGQPLLFQYSDTQVNDPDIQTAIQPFLELWDEFRVRKVVIEFFTQDNDYITDTDVIFPRMQYRYDATAAGRNQTAHSINQQANRKEVFFRPFQKVFVSFAPKFYSQVTGGQANIAQLGLGANPWRRSDSLTGTAVSYTSVNGIQTALYANPAQQVYYRYRITYDFKKLDRHEVYVTP